MFGGKVSVSDHGCQHPPGPGSLTSPPLNMGVGVGGGVLSCVWLKLGL